MEVRKAFGMGRKECRNKGTSIAFGHAQKQPSILFITTAKEGKLLTATCESSSVWKKNFFFVAAVQVERNITVQRGGWKQENLWTALVVKALKFHTFSSAFALPRIQKLKGMQLNNWIHPGKVGATTGTYAQYWCMQEEKKQSLNFVACSAHSYRRCSKK